MFEVYTKQEIDAKFAALPPPGSGGTLGKGLPVCFQLFGPVQCASALTGHWGPNYIFSGCALTPATKMFAFNCNFPHALFARWVHVWIPHSTNAWARLVHADNGPVNVTQIAEIQGSVGENPLVGEVDITAAFNALVDGKVYKNLGYQTKDDGVTDWTLYESRIEVIFAL